MTLVEMKSRHLSSIAEATTLLEFEEEKKVIENFKI